MITFSWILSLLIIGISFYPLSILIFRKFDDCGWMFSKIIGLLIAGWIIWVFNCLSINANPGAVILVCTCINYILLYRYQDKVKFEIINVELILMEELVFTSLLLLGAYLIGFSPDARGTEKPMDYMFMTAMMRDFRMPFLDPWYAGEHINYYYGGQYYAVFLTRCAGVSAGYGYNLMRATIAAVSFMSPFTLVRQMLRDRGIKHGWFGGILSGLAVGFSGNGHYIIYGIILPAISKTDGFANFMQLIGKSDAVERIRENTYWFAESTRYIGYNPDVADKTIHEFPAYSTILGDLHAHYINILFVITVVAVAYAWVQKKQLKRLYLCPEVWLIGYMTGLFRWTNYWDMPIYFVVCGSIFFFVLLRDALKTKKYRQFVINMIIIAVIMFAVGYICSLPFTLSFKTISNQIKITHKHTPLYQLLVLWGFPLVCVIAFIIQKLCEKEMKLQDLCVILLGICAIGLVLMPEVVYVVDIYGEEYERSNTMFKLTYQAYILFGICIGYIICYMIAYAKKKRHLIIPVLCLLFLVMETTYMHCGTKFFAATWSGLDASAFAVSFPDYGGIEYLNRLNGVHTIVEAVGDSYTDAGKVSELTGHQTVLGWPVHEWLWHNDYTYVGERTGDVRQIYTSDNGKEVTALLDKYGIEYIFVGQNERELYGDEVNDEILKSMGDIVWSKDTYYIVKVDLEKSKETYAFENGDVKPVYENGQEIIELVG